MNWIAVDAMGGDYAPRLVVDGALAAVRDFEFGVALVGPADLLGAELRRHSDVDARRVRVVDAPDVVTMEESPAAALRRKPGASIKVAADLVARGESSALFSAGHTGAAVMAAYSAFGTLTGVDRPALAATIPTRTRPPSLVDVVEGLLSEELSSTMTMRVGSLLTRRALRRLHRRLDYSEYGGAPLLGVAGVTIVGHGQSSARAVRNAVAMAYRFASNRFIE